MMPTSKTKSFEHSRRNAAMPCLNFLRSATGMMLLIGVSTFSTGAQEIAPLRQVYDGTMRPDLEVRTFARTDELFPVRKVERGNTARKLPAAKTPLKNIKFETGGKHYDLFDYLAL